MLKNRLHTPIFITGIERSGSTMVAKILGMCGTFVGPCSNMMENLEMKQTVTEYYHQIHADPRGQYPLPNTEELLIPSDWKDRIEGDLKDGDWAEDQIWSFKSATIAQTWPVWNYAFPNAKWIIVRRATRDILSSCLKTGFMDAYEDKGIQKAIGVEDEKAGWSWWVKQQEKLFVQMIEAGVNCKQIWPERMIDGDYRQMYETLQWVGLPWNNQIVGFLDSKLSKDKKGGSILWQ